MGERLVLVTGVAGDLGSYLVDELLKDGWTVCGLDRRKPTAPERERFHFLECDLSVAAQAEERIASFHDRFGAFDAVINCAGLIANAPLISFVQGKLVHHDPGLWDRVLGSCLSSAGDLRATVSRRLAC